MRWFGVLPLGAHKPASAKTDPQHAVNAPPSRAQGSGVRITNTQHVNVVSVSVCVCVCVCVRGKCDPHICRSTASSQVDRYSIGQSASQRASKSVHRSVSLPAPLGSSAGQPVRRRGVAMQQRCHVTFGDSFV